MKLECSSKGDKRFSALYAYVTVFNKNMSIENHYQLSKNFNGKRPTTFKEAKYFQHRGLKPTSFFIGNFEYDVKYLSQWYKLLWIKYLDSSPFLVEYAKQFDEFSDCFKNKATVNCQSDVIREYITNRRKLLESCKELILKIKEKYMIKKRTWKEFVNTGLLWWINAQLHLFGWVLVTDINKEGNITNVYPARCKFRGFSEKVNDEGYTKVTKYLEENITELTRDLED